MTPGVCPDCFESDFDHCGECWCCDGSVGDLVEHETDEDCICGPTPIAVERPDGSVGWVYCHHSLDNREATE